MEGSVEYLFAAAIGEADQAARSQGWLSRGRVGWQKPDGTVIHFICFVEQIANRPEGCNGTSRGRGITCTQTLQAQMDKTVSITTDLSPIGVFLGMASWLDEECYDKG
jgi:hypothetical protein